MPTNVPVPTFGPTGFQPPLESAILAGTQADLNQAFGGGLNPALNTPQGQLASSLSAIINDCYALFLLYTNLVDPALSSGRMQDAIGRIYFIERNASQPTVLQVNCIGQGATIPTGSLLQDDSGFFYQCTEAGVIPDTGSIVLTFANTLPGPLSVPSTITIYNSIIGWDAVNVVSGVEGNNEETASQFENRRSISVAQNSLGSLASILGAVLGLPGVLDAFVTENASNSINTIGGVSLFANSLFVCVLGGDIQQIAQTIWSRKPPGCTYNGNTTVTVYDTSPGYIPPFPQYSVTFQIPNPLDIVASVTMANNSLVPNNALALVQNALISGFAGQDGGPRAKIGTKLFTSRYYATIMALWPGAQIVSIAFGSPNAANALFTGSIALNVLTVTGIGFGPIGTGQTITDTTGAIMPGTTIISQSTGVTGSTGKYIVSISQTVTIEPMTSISATLNEVSVNIDQVPNIAPANITLTLL